LSLSCLLAMSSIVLAQSSPYTTIDVGGITYSTIVGTSGATEMTTVGNGDDVTEMVSLPGGFDFEYFGTPITSFSVSSNGQLNMDGRTSSHCCSSVSIPSSDGNDNAIFFCKEDLDPAPSGAVGGEIWQKVSGSAPNRTWTCEFSNVSWYPGPSSGFVNVQVILYESVYDIEIRYGTGNKNGNSFSAGIENATGTVGHPAEIGSFFDAVGRNATTAAWPTNQAVRFEHARPSAPPVVPATSTSGIVITMLSIMAASALVILGRRA
jgi:hypothetical protein